MLGAVVDGFRSPAGRAEVRRRRAVALRDPMPAWRRDLPLSDRVGRWLGVRWWRWVPALLVSAGLVTRWWGWVEVVALRAYVGVVADVNLGRVAPLVEPEGPGWVAARHAGVWLLVMLVGPLLVWWPLSNLPLGGGRWRRLVMWQRDWRRARMVEVELDRAAVRLQLEG